MDQKILDKLHENMFEIYEEVAGICESHNLTYFVVGGTLIGAVVHKGFIPWDDDMDIAMPRDDYDEFLKICKTELNERFYLHDISTDENYWLPFAKARINNTVFLEERRKNVKSHAGIYIDIFPFDYADEKATRLCSFKWRIINWINNYINIKVTGNERHSKSGSVLNPFFNLFSIKSLSKYRDRIAKSYGKPGASKFLDTAGGRALDNSYFNVDDILPVKEMPFEDKTVKVPANTDAYLTQLYTKKYKIIPPDDEQVTHEPVEIRFEDGTAYYAED